MNFWGNMARFFEQMVADKDKSWRKDVLTNKVEEYTVDTYYCADVRKWETGIWKNDGVVIVQEYPDKDAAVKGHEEWLEKCCMEVHGGTP